MRDSRRGKRIAWTAPFALRTQWDPRHWVERWRWGRGIDDGRPEERRPVLEWEELGVFPDDGPVFIAGVDVRKHESRPVGWASVRHPQRWTELHAVPAYEVDGPDGPILFACFEFAPGGYAFYIPRFDDRYGRS